MRKNKLLVVGLGVLLLTGIFSGLAVAENDSLHVVLTVEDRHYTAGDTVNLILRIYDRGQLADVNSTSSITVMVSTHHNMNDAQEVAVIAQSTGVYAAAYTVKGSDLDHGHLYFTWEVDRGSDHEEGEFDFDIYSVEDTVSVSFEGQKAINALAGDVVTATVLVRTGQTPIPITGFEELYVLDSDGEMTNLTYYTEANGIYKVDFVIPERAHSEMYEIVAQPIGLWHEDSAFIYVNVLDVWCHRLVSGSTVTFELGVADLEGQPIEGAFYQITRSGWPHTVYTGTTNSTGMDLISIPDVDGQVYFNGYALYSGLNQSVSGRVVNFEPEQPHNNEFDIVWEGSQRIFRPGEDAVIEYGAYDSQAPAGNQEIIYYVTATGIDFMFFSNHLETPREVIASGVVTTTALGDFQLEFEVPDDQCQIDVSFEVALDRMDFGGNEYDHQDDMYYAEWPQNQWNPEGFRFYAYEGRFDGDGDVSIGGSFSPGKDGTATVSIDRGNGDLVGAYWLIGESTIEDFVGGQYDPEWMRWTPGGQFLGLAENDKGKLEGGFMVPTFIEDEKVSILAGYVDEATGIPHFDAKTISPGGGFNWLWILIIVIIIAVVLVAVIVKTRM